MKATTHRRSLRRTQYVHIGIYQQKMQAPCLYVTLLCHIIVHKKQNFDIDPIKTANDTLRPEKILK